MACLLQFGGLLGIGSQGLLRFSQSMTIVLKVTGSPLIIFFVPFLTLSNIFEF